MNVLVLHGSNRPGSWSARLADVAVAALPKGTTVTTFDLATLPFYDEAADAEGRLGANAEAFRTTVTAADAIILSSPAYNGSMTALAKNAIDTASRPREGAPLRGKPVLLLSAVYSPGAEARVLDHMTVATTIAGGAPVGSGFGISHHFEAFDETGLVDKEQEAALRDLVAQLMAPISPVSA